MRRKISWASPWSAIINTWSDAQPCHQHFKQRVEEVKRGVWQAGGFPVELPALSLSESWVKPTTMLYRNLLALEVEELLRSHPVDGAVLMGGCDKTTPATIMGAISMDLPMVFMPAGPMMRAHHGGQILGSGSDAWKYWAEKEAGTITNQQWNDIEAGIARSNGTCMTMGTASTMTSIAEALGLTLPGASSIPAADAAHPRMATGCGRRIVDMIWEDLKPSDILDRALLRERPRRPQCAGRLDQRHDPPRGAGGARGRRAEAHRFRRLRAEGAGDRQPAPVGRLAHGGLLHLPAGSADCSKRLEGLLHLDARMRCVTAT